MVVRQALAGMMWTKQWYHYDVEQWLDGDPPVPPPEGRTEAATTSGVTSTPPTC